MSPASSLVIGCAGSVFQVVPSTKNLNWTGWFHGTFTVTVHALPEWVIGSPLVQAPAR